MRLISVSAGEPPLVFVHGFGCDATDWSAQFDSLATRTTVIACELPGHGSTEAEPADCTIEAYGTGLARALTGLELPPVVLVGHSMGCRVVLEANKHLPQAVSAVVLVEGSTMAHGDPGAARRAMADELAGDRYRPFVRHFFESMFFPGSDPVLVEAICDRGMSLPADIGRTLMASTAGWDAGEVEQALSAVGVPVLVIQSTTMDATLHRVPLSPGQSSSWIDLVRAHAPLARVEILPGSGHFPQIELADEVTELLSDVLRR